MSLHHHGIMGQFDLLAETYEDSRLHIQIHKNRALILPDVAYVNMIYETDTILVTFI